MVDQRYWERIVGLGLFEPDDPKADQRRALLEHYLARGVTPEAMAAADREGRLLSLLGEIGIRPGRNRRSADDLATETGLTGEEVDEALRAAGLPRVPPDQPYYSDRDRDLLLAFAGATELFGRDALLAFIRTLGTAASRVATAAIHLAHSNLVGALQEQGATELELSLANEQAFLTLDLVPEVLETVLRHHVEHELRRFVLSETGTHTSTLAVGFLDLVGFTARSAELDPSELAGAVAGFDALVTDLIGEHGARLVKIIGDEAMFVTHQADAACRLALAVRDAVADHPALSAVRGGITYGPVLTLDGDYYGSGVNLAARAVAVAEPGQVVVTEPVIETSGAEARPIGAHHLRGLPETVELFVLTG